MTEIVPGTSLLRVRGEIDQYGIDEFRAAIAAAERLATCAMIVELCDARLCSAAAYSTVIAAAARLGLTGCGPLLVVCASNGLASRVFGVLGFEHRCVATLVAAFAIVRCGDASLAVTYAESFLRATVS